MILKREKQKPVKGAWNFTNGLMGGLVGAVRVANKAKFHYSQDKGSVKD